MQISGRLDSGVMKSWRNSRNAVCARTAFSTMPMPELMPGTSGLLLKVIESSLTSAPNLRSGDPIEDYLFDEELYKERSVIERTNACIDGFRSILTRSDTTGSGWKGWNYPAFAVVP